MHRALLLLAFAIAGCRATPPTSSPDATPTMPAPVPPRILRVQPAGAPTHLVVVLHGVGANADDLYPVAKALSSTIPSAEWLVPDGFHPFSGGGAGREWFSIQDVTEQNRPARVRQAASEVSRWIDDELKKRNLGNDRLILVGFSQGSMLSQWLAVHRRPAAVVSFSGRFADDDASAKTTTPVLIVHGTHDAVIPVRSAEEARTALEARGARVTVSIHQGLGHGIDRQGLDEARAFLSREAK